MPKATLLSSLKKTTKKKSNTKPKSAVSPILNLKNKKSFTVVAIGASAGGLDAVTSLIKNLPANTGMAFIYVAHLSPDHKSYLTSILSRSTEMKVQEIDDMELMKPNNIYIIPYNKGIQVTNGHIKLISRPKNISTIDVLFSSLADTHKENVVGIILSGHAKDGAAGLKAIKAAGGVTFAQDNSAQASGMPKAAIATGMVDFVLSPRDIAKEIISISQNGIQKYIKDITTKADRVEYTDPNERTIFDILNKQKSTDFSHYKMATINRRMHNRMAQCNTPTIKEYVKLLLKDPNEVDLLYKDLLINVTGFFRDADVFKYLKTSLFPRLLKDKANSDSIRIWIPACSTGEEAYSIAMLFTDMQENTVKKIPVKIFATDLSDHVIGNARIGEYALSEMKTIPKNYLKRFFTKTSDVYRINKEIREMCTFAPHNILSDPPFFRVDFISCRNLLIYFDAAAQRKVMGTLHFALNEKGYLMLGKSETTGIASKFFTQINSKFKIYSRKQNSGTRKVPELIPRFNGITNYKKDSKPVARKAVIIDSLILDNAIDSSLLMHYIPACVIINKDMEILQFRGSTSLFLTHPSGGKASLNILKMIRSECAFELRSAIHTAIKTKKLVCKSDIEIKTDSGFQMMSLEVSPLKIEWDEPLLLIVFTLQEHFKKNIENSKGTKNTTPSKIMAEKDRRIKKLIEELAGTRSEMDTVIEAQEASYEELQAANEEIVSTSEEFQTLNEELETSKEELEATNEELLSTNHELKTQNELLTESYNYSEAIIATIHTPMLILDQHLHVKSANLAFYKKFKITKDGTVGKSLYKLGNQQWNIPKLRTLFDDILSDGTHIDNFEVTHTFPEIGEKTILLNASRIVQKAHGEKLILFSIKDVTEIIGLKKVLLDKERKILEDKLKLKKIESKQIEDSEKRYNMLIMKSPFAIAILKGKDMVITLANDSIKEMWGKGKYIEGKPLTKVIPELKGQPFPQLLDSVYTSGVPFFGNEMPAFLNRKGKIEQLYFNFVYQPYLEADETISGVTIIAYDVTFQVAALKKVEEAHVEQKDELEKAVKRRTRELQRKNIELEILNKDLTTFTYVSSHDLQEPLRKIQNFSDYILRKEKKNLSKEGKGHFNRMQETAKRMQKLIEDLLIYSQAKSPERNFAKTELRTIINEVKSDYEEIIKEKKATLIATHLNKINVIPSQFNQLFHNLIGNSLKFAKPNMPPQIKITSKIEKGSTLNIENVLPKIDYCHIVYTDNGIGFDPQYQERIFEVFQRLHSYEEYNGTGIGLAICKRIVENHKGFITATGKIDKGARFDIYIPV